MPQRTTRPALIIFLTGLLVATVGLVGLFAANRRREVRALGELILLPELGFAVRMPLGWEQAGPAGRTLFGPGLTYRRTGPDSSAEGIPSRYMLFLSIPPGASDEQVLAPLGQLAVFWNANNNDFHSPQLPPLGPARLDSRMYEHRQGKITFRYRNSNLRLPLVLYQQIKVGRRVFWCIIMSNNRLNAADQALLDAVASSFEMIDNPAN